MFCIGSSPCRNRRTCPWAAPLDLTSCGAAITSGKRPAQSRGNTACVRLLPTVYTSAGRAGAATASLRVSPASSLVEAALREIAFPQKPGDWRGGVIAAPDNPHAGPTRIPNAAGNPYRPPAALVQCGGATE